MEPIATVSDEAAAFEAEPYSDETVLLRIGKTHDFRTAPLFSRFFEQQIEVGVRNFILDFSETKFLDAAGLRSVFELHRRTRGEVVFAAPTHPVQTVVRLMGLQGAFRQFATTDAAFEALQGSGEEGRAERPERPAGTPLSSP